MSNTADHTIDAAMTQQRALAIKPLPGNLGELAASAWDKFFGSNPLPTQAPPAPYYNPQPLPPTPPVITMTSNACPAELRPRLEHMRQYLARERSRSMKAGGKAEAV